MRISDWSSDVCSSDLIGGIEIAIREMREQLGDAVLDQVDARRFERFEESRSEAERDDVGVPRALPHPGAEAQRSGFGERAALDVGEQDRGRFIFADEVAAKDKIGRASCRASVCQYV